MTPACHICKRPSPFLLNKDGFDMYRCPSCALVFVHPQPTPEYLKEEVYSYKSGYQSNRTGDLSVNRETRRARTALDYLEKAQPKGHILDVGCAQGQFMYWAKQRGFTASGVELNKRTADSATAQGMDVFNGFLDDAAFQPASFDAVFLGEIIEHVNDPRSFVASCAKLLAPNGTLVITTPNLDCFWCRSTYGLYRLFGIPWGSLTPPYHLFQFDEANLDLLLSQEGFKPIYSAFLVVTRLKYELGMIHIVRRFKKDRTVKNAFMIPFAVSLYTLLYVVNLAISPFTKRDFNMIKAYTRS